MIEQLLLSLFWSVAELQSKRLYLVSGNHLVMNLQPSSVDDVQMGLVFKELISKFAILPNETASQHITPRVVIRLMVKLPLSEYNETLTKSFVVQSMDDPSAGTGRWLEDDLLELRPPTADLTEIAVEVLGYGDQVEIGEPMNPAECVAGAHTRAAASHRSAAHAVAS
jgi:hypothetical protein